QSLGLCVCVCWGSTYSVGILGESGSQCQDRGSVLWVRAPTWTMCQQEALLGETCDTGELGSLGRSGGLPVRGAAGPGNAKAPCGWGW
ncbi:unnamed protein product, partial [Gulo gulo]